MDTPRRHQIYEINTAPFLTKLSRRYGHTITLGAIPDEELDVIASFGTTAVWFMGIWRRSPIAVDLARQDGPLVNQIKTLLPDYQPDDIIGSAYAVNAYQIDERFGDETQLRNLRERLRTRGISLLLDFVPNHTALDHPWITEDPTRYIRGTAEDLATHPSWFWKDGDEIIARGRDPHFEPWSDVAQLNAFSLTYRQASITTLSRIATMCDGVRCDMAMLLTNDVFAATWGEKAGPVPDSEYWTDVISTVREQAPEFIFIAECYWHMETVLINQGFDYCYDKDWRDLLLGDDAEAIVRHLETTAPIAEHLVHFLENHDEPRAATSFSHERHMAAAYLTTTLPGATLYYDGQYSGYPSRIPVHIDREPLYETDQHLADYYKSLLAHQRHDIVEWSLLPNSPVLVGRLSNHRDVTLLANYSAQPFTLDATIFQTAQALSHSIVPVDTSPIDVPLTSLPLNPWQIIELRAPNHP